MSTVINEERLSISPSYPKDHVQRRKTELDKILRIGSPKVENFIRKRIPDHHDKDDILQQTYLAAWQHRRRYACHSEPTTWICGIALNMIRKYYKSFYSQRTLHEDIDAITPQEVQQHSVGPVNPSNHAEHNQLLQLTYSFMHLLPKDMKEIIEDRVIHEDSYRATSQRLGINIGTVRSRLSRARASLRELTHGLNTDLE